MNRHGRKTKGGGKAGSHKAVSTALAPGGVTTPGALAARKPFSMHDNVLAFPQVISWQTNNYGYTKHWVITAIMQ